MITDRELDLQLAAAAGVRDTDLPALPEDFLGLVTAEDERTQDRPRRPSRKTTVRLGVALVAVAAAWTTAVVITPREDAGTPPAATGTPTPGVATPAEGMALVAAEPATFPLSLDPPPPGLTPTFSRWGGTAFYGDQPLVFSADYASAGADRVLVRLFPEDPRAWGDQGWSLDGDLTATATVAGVQAEVRSGDGYLTLLWERPDGRWTQILGEGAYSDQAAAVAVGNSLVDRPQPVGLQFGLAPAGWSLGGYEESRSLDLVSDSDPAQSPLRVSLIDREGGATLDSPFEGTTLAAAPATVTVHGLPAKLALAKRDEGSGDYWYLVGQFSDGPLFLMLAPQFLTQDQVLQIAEQTTYTP